MAGRVEEVIRRLGRFGSLLYWRRKTLYEVQVRGIGSWVTVMDGQAPVRMIQNEHAKAAIAFYAPMNPRRRYWMRSTFRSSC